MPEYSQIEDTQVMTEIKEYSMELASANTKRNADYKEYEAMYLMEWEGKDDPRFEGTRVTVETSPREAVEGMTRLLTGTDPVWKVDAEKAPAAELIETELAAWWNGSSRAARQPHQYDLVRSGVMYGAMDAAITPTQELLAYARKGKTRATIVAAERLAERTPWLVDVWNPKAGNPAYDAFGLAAYHRQVDMTAADIESRYGPLPEAITSKGKWKTHTLNIFYNREWFAVWMPNHEIICKKHKLPMIPIVSQAVDGSMLFDKPEYQRQPPLYALLRSGLWDTECIYLTVVATTILAMGTVGKWLHTAPPSSPGKKLNIDWTSQVIELDAGESLAPLSAKGLMDPDAAAFYQLAQSKSEGVTIHKQALGAPMTRDATFSEISLLAQAGRLPLIAPQKKGGWAMGEIAEIMLGWARENPSYIKGRKLKKADIPRALEVLCALEVSLPQDVLQNANIARLLSQGEDPLVSKEWARENILKIAQPQKEETKVWDERAATMAAMQEIQKILQEAAAAAANPGGNQFPGVTLPGGGQPGQPGAPGDPMQGAADPAAGPMMGAPDQAQAIQGGLPPAQAGMLPGMGQGNVPPEMMQGGGMPGA